MGFTVDLECGHAIQLSRLGPLQVGGFARCRVCRFGYRIIATRWRRHSAHEQLSAIHDHKCFTVALSCGHGGQFMAEFRPATGDLFWCTDCSDHSVIVGGEYVTG